MTGDRSRNGGNMKNCKGQKGLRCDLGKALALWLVC